MSIISTFSHSLIHRYYRKRTKAFKDDMSSFKEFQLKQLKKLLLLSETTSFGKSINVSAKWDYETFSSNVPISEYENYEDHIIKQMKDQTDEICVNCTRYQPTSGSTSGRKWIPYSKEFTEELDMAIGPWIGNLYSTYPRIKSGKHYWSLSWMPNELREKLKDLDDLNVFSKWQQIIMRMTMASPNTISNAKTAETAQLATLAWLCSTRDLTMLFVWSPTFALNLMDDLKKFRLDLIKILKQGNWGEYKNDLAEIDCPKSIRAANLLKDWNEEIGTEFLEQLWPKMSLVSSWDTASSKSWAKKLRNLFNKASFQGKGLFATEGVVTIPFNCRFVLSYKSHFYEFEVIVENDQPNKIIPSWELKNGMIVSPLLTTGSGFFRYKMKDRLEVVDFMNKCPCLVFKGRMGDVDLVGEKTSPEMVEKMFQRAEEKFPGLKCVSLMGVMDIDEKPYYFCLCEKKQEENIKLNIIEISKFIESELKGNFHYALARDLGQLMKSSIVLENNVLPLYNSIVMNRGMVKGDIKLEILTQITKDQLKGVL